MSFALTTPRWVLCVGSYRHAMARGAHVAGCANRGMGVSRIDRAPTV